MAVMTRRKRFAKAMSTAFRSLGAVFYPKNIKNAFKSVTKGAREYLCFFVALFAIQAGFVTFALMTDANISYAKTLVTDEYSHHLEVVGMDQEQKVNLQYNIDLAVTRLDDYILSASFVQEADETYTARIVLNENMSLTDGRAHLLGRNLLGGIAVENADTGEPWTLRTTPLYTYGSDYETPYTATFWGVLFLWLLISVAVLWVLYRVRVNHFKFVYGIYMTCGADFPKLYGTAGGELMAVSLLTLLPAILMGGGVTAIVYLTKGIALSISLRTVICFVIFNLLCVLLAVYVPMRRMATKPPVSLLAAVDNSSLVASPRRSFRMFGEGYPLKYELFGMWRLRKYYVGLVLSAVLFAALFVSGLYIADLEKYHAEIDPYEYLIRYGTSPSEVSDEVETDAEGEEIIVDVIDREEAEMIRDDLDIFLDEVVAVPGVSYVDWAVTTSGGSRLSHLLLTPGQLSGGTESTVPSAERESQGYKYAMREYDYTAFDKTYIDMLVDRELCTFEGNPYDLLEGERMVIVSEDSFNEKCYNFAPGDKIIVAVFEKMNGVVDMVFDPDTLLRMQIEKYDFKYVEYTVAAVMRGKASQENITFGVTFADYEELTGDYAVRNQLKVYMENGTDFATVQAAEAGIRKAVSYCAGWRVVPSGNYFKTDIRNQRNDRAMILTLASLILLTSPLVWFFSQLMYYRKRRGELRILLALGAKQNSLGTLHRITGGVLSGAAFLATVILSYLCNAAVHLLINTLLPKFGIIESVGYAFELSWPALWACLLVSVLCGFLSCEVPYRLFRRNEKAGSIVIK